MWSGRGVIERKKKEGLRRSVDRLKNRGCVKKKGDKKRRGGLKNSRGVLKNSEGWRKNEGGLKSRKD